MRGNAVRKSKLAGCFFALAALAVPAFAGTPLLCHRFDIGNARSLPWGAAGNSWNSPDTTYDTARLVDDTLALLADSTPVVVRMETIRRAVIYTKRNDSLGRALLERFRARADQVDQGKPNALHLFDYGYLIETMNQASLMEGLRAAAGAHGGGSGYSIIQEALQWRGSDPEMEFAASVVAVWPRRPEYREHFRRAVAGAANDSLLTKNLLEQFPEQGRTLDELRASADMVAKED